MHFSQYDKDEIENESSGELSAASISFFERTTINKYKTIPKQNGKVVVFKLLGVSHET